MALTRMVAKNTFGDGLILDFAPDNTQATHLTNALNATMLTYNGNELSLLNDMGNCRIESAYLPLGYVPVGTCEFGDIIYIVSYNPLENKSLIGCFPSPERNISNKEISELELRIDPSNLTNQGYITSNTTKRIIYGNSNINAGDKFLISWGEAGKNNADCISNYGNTTKSLELNEGYWPKLTKVHVVSIEDSGKITFLDTTVKWYDDANKKPFIISKENFNTMTDDDLQNIDQYRHALQCNYSVFQSKVAGKLALLLELETIDSFNCTHKVIPRVNGTQEYYDVYLSVSWETDNYNINPMGMLITSVKETNMESYDIGSLKDKLLWHTSPVDVNRVIYFSRLYEMENPQNDYQSFLSKSFYTNIDKYKSIKEGNVFKVTGDMRGIDKSIPRIFRISSVASDGSYIPSTSDDGLKGYYVADPSKAYTSAGNTIYQTRINNDLRDCIKALVEDDVVVNYFKQSVLKKIGTVKKKQGTNKLDHTIEYTVCPCMPYGPLSHLSITNTIDFDKKETGEVNLTTWRYYVKDSEEDPTITLNFGFETKLQESKNEVIDRIFMEFYDNIGLCATYELNGQDSYDGKFTEYIELNRIPSNFRVTNKLLSSTDPYRKIYNVIAHPDVPSGTTYGDISNEIVDNEWVYQNSDGKYECITSEKSGINSQTDVRVNNSGILYSGRPYLVKIIIYKGRINEIGIVETDSLFQDITYYRWLWTIPLFNDNYVNSLDFGKEGLKFPIELDCKAVFNGKQLASLKLSYTYINGDYKAELLNENKNQTLGAQIDIINRNNDPSINFYGDPTIKDFYRGKIFLCRERFDRIKVQYGVANKRIETDSFETLYDELNYGEIQALYPRYDDIPSYDISGLGAKFYKAIGMNLETPSDDLFDNVDAFENYKDGFNVSFTGTSGTATKEPVTYIDSKGYTHTENIDLYTVSGNLWSDLKIFLKLQGIKYNKIIAGGVKKSDKCKVLTPIIDTVKDLEAYNMALDSSQQPFFKEILYLGLAEPGGHKTYITAGILSYDTANTAKMKILYDKESPFEEMYASFSDKRLKDIFLGQLRNYPFTPIVLGRANTGEGSVQHMVLSTNAKPLTTEMGTETLAGDRWITGDNPPQPLIEKTGDYYKVLDKPFEYQSSRRNLFSFVGIFDGEELYGTADAAILTVENQQLKLNINWKFNASEKPLRYAELYASFLSQLYAVKNETVDFSVLYNTAKLSNHNETWKADVVMKLSLKDAYNTVAGFSENSACALLNIFPQEIQGNGLTYYGMNLQKYLSDLLDNAKISDRNVIKPENVNPEIKECAPIVVELVYDIPYNVSEVEHFYETRQASSYYIKDNIAKSDNTPLTITYSPVLDVIDESKLYVKMENDRVVPYNAGAKFKLVKSLKEGANGSLKAFLRRADLEIKMADQYGLVEALGYDGNTVRIKDIEKLQGFNTKYYWQLDASGDDPRINDLRAIKLFNYSLFI